MMHVLFCATSYPRSATDWQSIFIRRMADGLAASGDTELRVWAPPGPLHPAAEYVCHDDDVRFLSQLAEDGGIAHLLRTSRARGAYRGAELVWRLHKTFRQHSDWADIYHVNWLQCALGQFGLTKPVVATVLGSDLALLEKPGVANALRLALRNRRVVLCPNAPWMVQPLRTLLGPGCPQVICVPFGIDESWFNVKRRCPSGKHIWITVLRLTRAKIGQLFEWTRDFDPNLHEFHLFGPRQEAVDVPPWIHYHGAATPEQLAKEWFPSATGMITLSQHAEGRPQVILEAMAAGLPVVCSRSQAHEDVISEGESGFLVSTVQEFTAALARLSDSVTGAVMADRTRTNAKSTYGSWADCAGRFRQIYQQLLDGT